jgi:hypothetical protein
MTRLRRLGRIAKLSGSIALALMLPPEPRWSAELREVTACLLIGELVTELCRVDCR